MPTLKETTEAIDARVGELTAWIAATQDDYAKTDAKGRFAQLDWSHATDPADGEVKQPDRLSRKLPGKTKTWTDFGYPIESPLCNACVHEYDGPQGKGWVLILSMKFGGKRYMRHVGHGPENRTTEWAEVVPL